MRKGTAIVAALVCICIPATASAHSDRKHPGPACVHDHGHGGATFAPLIRRAWNERKWEKSNPVSDSQAKRIKHHRRCAALHKTKGNMISMSKRQRQQFRAYAAAQQVQNAWGDIDPPGAAYLAGLRACESGGNYQAVDPSGTYWGAYQFDLGTWASVGGSGNPADASPAEQDYRAAVLWRRSGSAPWPVCG